MSGSLARRTEAANFAQNLGYSGAAKMFFPAGIPLTAVVALIIWNARQEAERERERERIRTGSKPS
jgi:hypothetical protein